MSEKKMAIKYIWVVSEISCDGGQYSIYHAYVGSDQTKADQMLEIGQKRLANGQLGPNVVAIVSEQTHVSG